MVNGSDWDLSDLPEDYTVDDVMARAPQYVRDIVRVYRLRLYLPERTDGYVPEFFFELNFAELMEAKSKLQVLVDSGRVLSYNMTTETPVKASFLDSIIKLLVEK